MKRSALMLVVLTGIAAGCGGTSAEPVQTDLIEPPASWTVDGKSWTYQPVPDKSDEELLMKFFQSHAQYQGSSDFDGPPKMMMGERTNRRFYWIRGGGDAASWSCIHFENGQFSTSEGTGNPF